MISAITGRLISVVERTALLQVGAMQYELLVPAFDAQALGARVGTEVTFHTIFYLEGDPSRGGLEPRLIGFSSPRDKAFFEKFTTVKGIGTKTALRALSVPINQIASAIESRNARFLTQLDGIGKRTAELVIAELSGKVATFAAGSVVLAESSPSSIGFSSVYLDAINAMVSLGERRSDAERLAQSAMAEHPEMTAVDAVLREMLRMRAS